MNKKNVLFDVFFVFFLTFILLIVSFSTSFSLSNTEARNDLRAYSNEVSLSINEITYESLRKSFLYLVENEEKIKEKIKNYLLIAKGKRQELIYELQR